jgi:hypothetical protein
MVANLGQTKFAVSIAMIAARPDENKKAQENVGPR